MQALFIRPQQVLVHKTDTGIVHKIHTGIAHATHTGIVHTTYTGIVHTTHTGVVQKTHAGAVQKTRDLLAQSFGRKPAMQWKFSLWSLQVALLAVKDFVSGSVVVAVSLCGRLLLPADPVEPISGRTVRFRHEPVVLSSPACAGPTELPPSSSTLLLQRRSESSVTQEMEVSVVVAVSGEGSAAADRRLG